jgi:hypothetical protein
MKARLFLSALLGLVLSAGAWLIHSWASKTGEARVLDPANLPTANSPAFSDWRRIWAEHNPEPNLLDQAPTGLDQNQTPILTATCPCNSPATSDTKQKVAELMKEFNTLFKEGKYGEAMAVARKAHEIDPDCEITTSCLHIAHNKQVSSAPESVESKLDQVLAKLEQVEKRLEALDKQRQADTLEKLERLLERVNQLESRLQEAEQDSKTQTSNNFFGLLHDLFFLRLSFTSPDPNARIKEAFGPSEDLRTIKHQPSLLTPNRVDGAIQ